MAPVASEAVSPKGESGSFHTGLSGQPGSTDVTNTSDRTPTRLSASYSAPALLGRGGKGVQISVDPSSPSREVQEDVDTMLIPNVAMLCTVDSQMHSPSKPAWASPPSRPGSRGPKYSSRSSSSSVSGRASGPRFTTDEALCFRRLPTPSSSCQHKREMYWQVGGSGELRRNLSESNWHLLPVLKGKFYQHPKLCDTPNRRSNERARQQRLQKKREEMAKSNRIETLPDEALTASVLEEIYPRTPVSKERPRSSGAASMAMDEAGEQTLLPSSEKMRSLVEVRNRIKSAIITKRLSATDTVKSQDGIKQEPSSTELTSVTHASNPNITLGGTLNATLTGAAAAAVTGPQSKAALIQASGQAIMLEFRKQLLERFETVKHGFDCFSTEVQGNREMTKKEWRRVLSKLGFVSTVEERDAIFEQLDINNNGHVSMSEFHIAIEAAAPVRTMEDLRRRWLASNYSSMAQAINLMDDGGATSNRRLTLKEFGEALSRVHVNDHSEHVCIFNAIVDTSDRSSKVSIGELASAIATVSPAMFIEDIRHRLLKRYAGHVERAFWDLDPDHSGMVSLTEFLYQGRIRLGFTDMEATKIFRGIDVDASGQVTKSEFLCALCMSEPSIYHEDLRTKIRQRYRSIQACFAAAMEDSNNTDLHQNPKLSFNRFQELLKHMELSDTDLRTLFELIDANGDGALTIREFNHGVRHFAPSCVLEDLRVQCLMRHDTVAEVFVPVPGRSLPDRAQALDIEGFEKLLESYNLTSGVQVQAIFDLLDVRNEGNVSLGKLIAALQSGGPGCTVRLPPEERDQKAEQDIKTCLMHHHKFAGDLKTLVRANPKTPEDQHNIRRQTSQEAEDGSPLADIMSQLTGGKVDRSGIAVTCRAAWQSANAGNGASGGKKERTLSGQSPPRAASPERQRMKDGNSTAVGGGMDEEGSMPQSNVAPRLRALPQEELAKYMAKLDPCRITDHKKIAQDPIEGAQKTWGKVWDYLHKTPGNKHTERVVMEKDLLSYFQTTTKSMSHDMPLLERSHSRHAIHKSVKAHTRALAQPRGMKG